MKKLLTVVFSAMLVFSFGIVPEVKAKKIVETVYVLKFNGKKYYPEKAKSYPSAQSELLEKIVTAKQYDNAIALKYKNNIKLIPVKDLLEDYKKVFKYNDLYLLDILDNRNYNAKILDAYLDYFQNMINNFKQNRELFVQREQDSNTLKNIDLMLKDLIVQQKELIRYFDQLQNLRGL